MTKDLISLLLVYLDFISILLDDNSELMIHKISLTQN